MSKLIVLELKKKDIKKHWFVIDKLLKSGIMVKVVRKS